MNSLEYFKRQRERNTTLKKYFTEYTNELDYGKKYVLINCDLKILKKPEGSGTLVDITDNTNMRITLDTTISSLCIIVSVHKEGESIKDNPDYFSFKFSSFSAEILDREGSVSISSTINFGEEGDNSTYFLSLKKLK